MATQCAEAREAWEQGHSILVHSANRILHQRGFSVIVEKPRKPLPEDRAFALLDAYEVLDAILPPLLRIRNLKRLSAPLWLLGQIDVASEIATMVELRHQATRDGRNYRAIGRLEGIERSAGWLRDGGRQHDAFRDWTIQDWMTRFVEPMQANAKEWRKRLQSRPRKRRWSVQTAEPYVREYIQRAVREGSSIALRAIERDTTIPKSTIQKTRAWKELGSDKRGKIHVNTDWTADEAKDH